MPQFNFKARITLEGCDVTVEADNEAEARVKATEGDWVNVDYNIADTVDYTITKSLGKEPV